MNDYERMARIIHHLDENYTEQPSLEDLAAVAQLSPSHFHRQLSSFVGVTPKDFVQCLTMKHAKDLLRRGESILDASLDSGLSGPGRLHDLCVGLEAVSPGELKNQGSGLTISYGCAVTPFGDCLIGQTSRGICHLSFIDAENLDSEITSLSKEWPEAQFERNDATAASVIHEIFINPKDNDKPGRLRVWVKGSQFQLTVWRALFAVPFGSLVTYGQLAKAIDQPKAARAVGTAVARNPLAILIPCHRVIRDTGIIGQYRWGTGRKRALIAWETASTNLPQSEESHQTSDP